MFDQPIAARLLAVLCALVVFSNCHGQDAKDLKSKRALSSDHWQKEGWPLIKQFCIDCHNEDDQSGELDLSNWKTVTHDGDAAHSMNRVLEMVRFGAMPPDDSDLPTPAERKQLVTALDKALYSVACDLRPRPGKVTARRLNRAEYNNSIRDLFGLDLKPADAFPSDEVGAGFDNNGDVLSLSPLQIEKYLDAAEMVASKVLVDPSTLPRLDDQIAPDQIRVHGKTRTGRFNGRFMDKESFAWFDVSAPLDGEYRFEIRGGNSTDGNPKSNVAVYNQDGLLVGVDDFRYYGGGGSSQRIDFRVRLEKGDHRFFLEPIEDGDKREFQVGKSRSKFFAEIDHKIIADAERRAAAPLRPDSKFNLRSYPFMFRRARVEGPTRMPDDLYPPSQHKILRRYAKLHDGKWRDVRSAATENLKHLMLRAFRRPVTGDEIEPYAQLAVDACERGESFYRAMQISISAVLVSPHFLFRVETPGNGKKPQDGGVELDSYQMATRLAYFLWSSTPDEHLLNEAKNNRLTGKTLQQNVRRMLSNEKSEAFGKQFAAQWFGLRNLDGHEADTEEAFQDLDPKLIGEMSRETELVFLDMVRSNKPIADLLTIDYTFVNGRLAKHYGVKFPGKDPEKFERVSLKETPRRGVLSHAGMLTLTSYPTRTSPVLRGKWILENVLGTPPPDPPADVPELSETKTADENASLREQLELHRKSPTCASCHRVMDQLGFGLEQFDAIGRYREKEHGKAIDANGVLPGGRKFNGAAELSQVLGKTEREAFARTAVHRMLTFAIGRELAPSDRCIVDEIIQKTKKNDHRFVDVILEVVESRPFRFIHIDPQK